MTTYRQTPDGDIVENGVDPMAKRDNQSIDDLVEQEQGFGESQIIDITGPNTHPVPYPNVKDRREFFQENSHPVPYPKDEKPYRSDTP